MKYLIGDIGNTLTKITLLDEVPCGDKFSNCKFIKDAAAAKKELPNLIKIAKSFAEKQAETQNELDVLNREKINSYIEKHEAVLEKKNNVEKELT